MLSKPAGERVEASMSAFLDGFLVVLTFFRPAPPRPERRRRRELLPAGREPGGVSPVVSAGRAEGLLPRQGDRAAGLQVRTRQRKLMVQTCPTIELTPPPCSSLCSGDPTVYGHPVMQALLSSVAEASSGAVSSPQVRERVIARVANVRHSMRLTSFILPSFTCSRHRHSYCFCYGAYSSIFQSSLSPPPLIAYGRTGT